MGRLGQDGGKEWGQEAGGAKQGKVEERAGGRKWGSCCSFLPQTDLAIPFSINYCWQGKKRQIITSSAVDAAESASGSALELEASLLACSLNSVPLWRRLPTALCVWGVGRGEGRN